MKIRVTDLELLMFYLEKENTMDVDVSLSTDEFVARLQVEFDDIEGRQCKITLFPCDEGKHITPDLQKKMKLRTRGIKKGGK